VQPSSAPAIGQTTHGEKPSALAALAPSAELNDRRPTASFLAGSAAAFLGIAATVALDVVMDTRAGASTGHMIAELATMVFALCGVGVIAAQLVAARRRARALQVDLGRARADAERYRADADEVLRGLGAAIDRQFDRWGLSPAEREIGLLLLKGLSHKEIASMRDTSERTVRQQALAVYRKAGLSGRAELAAFFLEDLLLPRGRPRGVP
jgi:DNA-binding CsgD family transcriptional regulator